ncbi:MAG: ABC transporter permease subunit [bacterium]
MDSLIKKIIWKEIKICPSLYLNILLFLIIIVAVIISYLIEPNPGKELSPPTWEHIFGTDDSGEDIFLRTIVAIRRYFFPGLLAVGIVTLLGGIILGVGSSSIWSEVFIGKVGISLTSSIMDVLESFPKYITILLIITFLDPPQFRDIVIVLGVLNSAKLGRLVKLKIESLQKNYFIEANEALGLGKFDIVFRHILFYNCLPIFIIQASLQMAEVIMIEIGVNYLASTSPWGYYPFGKNYFGAILVDARDKFEAWWFTFFPVIMVVTNILVFYGLADSINRRIKLHQHVGLE